MVSRRPPQDVDGSHHPGIAGQCPCLQRRTVQDRTRPAVRPLCLRHADCRQLYQRPLRLPERDRPSGRPAGAAARLRRRLDYAGSHENRHRHRTDTVVPGRAGSAVHRLGAAAPRRLGTGGAGRGGAIDGAGKNGGGNYSVSGGKRVHVSGFDGYGMGAV